MNTAYNIQFTGMGIVLPPLPPTQNHRKAPLVDIEKRHGVDFTAGS